MEELLREEDSPAWLMTYGDLMTLLLVFFILLYTIFYLETERFKTVLSSIEVTVDAEGNTLSVVEYAERALHDHKRVRLEEATGLREKRARMLMEVQSIVAQNNWDENVAARVEDDKVLIRVKGEALFPSGLAELSPNAVPVFERIRAVIEQYPDYQINIKGHTDDRSISNAKFSSNWELSATRATTVLRYLIEQGVDPERLTATGYADLMPIRPNDSPVNRAINRRVEFVLEKKAID
jgi:chemotaxis protein MotB